MTWTSSLLHSLTHVSIDSSITINTSDYIQTNMTLSGKWICMYSYTVHSNFCKWTIPWSYWSLFHQVQNFKSMDNPSKYSIQTIQMWLFTIRNEKLTAICIRSTVGHWKYPSCIVLQGIPYLIIEFSPPYAGPSSSCTRWISTLNHKTFNVPMKYCTIIIATGT